MKKFIIVFIIVILLGGGIVFSIYKNILWQDALKKITIESYAEKYDTANPFFYGSGNRFSDIRGNAYQIAGIVVPMYYPNELPEYMNKVKKELINKTVYIKIIEKAKVKYPKFPLVLIYFNKNDKISFNEKWLRQGNAFFDHGYFKDKEVFEKAEQYAKERSLGVWNETDKLKVLFIGHKEWKFFYEPQDSKVQEIAEEDRIYYYIVPPVVAGYKSYMPIGRSKKNW